MGVRNAPDQRLIQIVQWAVRERKRCLRYGWGHVDHNLATVRVDVLEQWLRTHFRFGAETVRQFDASHGLYLRYTMPSTAAGKEKLRAYDKLILDAKS